MINEDCNKKVHSHIRGTQTAAGCTPVGVLKGEYSAGGLFWKPLSMDAFSDLSGLPFSTEVADILSPKALELLRSSNESLPLLGGIENLDAGELQKWLAQQDSWKEPESEEIMKDNQYTKPGLFNANNPGHTEAEFHLSSVEPNSIMYNNLLLLPVDLQDAMKAGNFVAMDDHAKLVVQPSHPEVSRGVYFSLQVALTFRPHQVFASVQYEDGSSCGSSASVFEGKYAVGESHNVFVQCRMQELSRSHRNQRFCLCLHFVSDASSWQGSTSLPFDKDYDAPAMATVITEPLKVLSKTCIVRAHAEGRSTSKKRKEISVSEDKSSGTDVRVGKLVSDSSSLAEAVSSSAQSSVLDSGELKSTLLSLQSDIRELKQKVEQGNRSKGDFEYNSLVPIANSSEMDIWWECLEEAKLSYLMKTKRRKA